MNKLDFDAINQALDPATVVPQWLPNGHKRGTEWVAPNPTRNDRNPGSFTISLVNGQWKDFATGDGGSDPVSLYAYLFHANDQGAAARELAANHGVRIGDPVTRQAAAEAAKVRNIEEAKPEPIFPVPMHAGEPSFKHPRWGEPAARWEYKDKNGRTLLWVCRFDPPGERKQVVPRSWCKFPDGKEGWAWRGITGTKKRPLYGLDRLAADAEADAIVVEGEKATDAGQRLLGDAAIVCSWLGGVETADRVNINALAGRRVVLWPDADALRQKLSAEAAEAIGADAIRQTEALGHSLTDADRELIRKTAIEMAARAMPLLPIHEQPGVRAMMHLATALKGVAREVVMVGYSIDPERHGWDLADAEAQGWDSERVQAHLAANAGDPWHIASARAANTGAAPVTTGPVGATTGPAPDTTPPANDNEPPRLPLDASVNPFGFPHMGEKGQPLNTVENLAYLLGEYGITARYNIIRKNVEVVIPGRQYSADNRANAALAELTSVCARNRMPQSMLADYVKLIADAHAYNPVTDWIESRPWDGQKRIQAICATVQVAGDRALTDKLIFRWLVSAVAAVFMPAGFESHGVLVFTGPQGQGKTKWVKRLVAPLPDVVLAGAVLDPNNKDTVTNAISHWIVELGELDATFRKADIARLKSFVTNSTDKVRRPYDRIESEYQRRTVFFASVNEDRYLVDDTGNRRWWTVPVVAVDYSHSIDVQQLWAEVLHLWRQGEQHWLTAEEFQALNRLNAEHENVDPVEEMIQAAFDWENVLGGNPMTASEVLQVIGYDKPNKAQATHASKVLKKLTGKEPHKTGKGRFFSMPPRVKGAGKSFDHQDESRPF